MVELKSSKYPSIDEWIKSGFIAFIPMLIVRTVLASIETPALLTASAAVTIIGAVHLLRRHIKSGRTNDWSIALLAFIFFPAGIYYLWRYSGRPAEIKALATIAIVGLVLYPVFVMP